MLAAWPLPLFSPPTAWQQQSIAKLCAATSLLRTMESLVQTFNILEQVSKAIGNDGFHLPRIVVVGSQGSGKSSVLENIVGRSFLPKGTGIVTRTPLVLNLVHSPREPGPHRREEDGTLDVEEYGVFGHTDAIFKDFDEICSEIQRQTVKIAGLNKGICDQDITLNLYSPRLPNLTLVDLPGLTKFPIGDQPADVETQIRNLVLEYIQNTDAIIMAVVPANTDMATNESLKLTKECDPEGLRTLVVLTKVDLMDAGTDATDILTGKVIPVKLGIVAVVNRSQKDIADKKPIAQVIMDEAEFLRLKYPSLADCNGTSFLVSTLKKLLLKNVRVKDYLVEVNSRVEMKILQAEALVDFYSGDDEEQDRGLMKIIREFSSAYSEDVRASGANLETKTGASGTPIYHIIHKVFKTELNKINHDFTKERIVNCIEMHNGPHECFNELMQWPIREMTKPSLDCAQRVFEEMNQVLWKCAYERNLLIQKFPALRNKILVVLGSLLRRKHRIAEKAIGDEFFYELSRIMFDIRRFDKNSDVLNREEFQKRTKDEKYDLIMKYFPSYLETARETVHTDVTVKIMQLLVNEVENNVEDELVGKFSSPRTGGIFHGDQNFSEEGKKEKKTLEALCKARDIIGELEEKC